MKKVIVDRHPVEVLDDSSCLASCPQLLHVAGVHPTCRLRGPLTTAASKTLVLRHALCQAKAVDP